MNTLYDQQGHRKYLTRISEALALTPNRIVLKDGAIVIESAKKRKSGIYRPVPVRYRCFYELPPIGFDALISPVVGRTV